MKTVIRILGWLLLIQFAYHIVFYVVAGMDDGFRGIGEIIDADLVRITAGLTAIYLCRGNAMDG